METIKNITTRFGPTGALFLGLFILLIYIALGFFYFQQGTKQRDLQAQIVKLGAIIAKPLSSREELQAQYNNVTSNLTPMTDKDYIATLVNLAEKSGIDVTEKSKKFLVPPATYSNTKVGGDTYQLISFKKIYVQGDYDSIMNFISRLDSGAALKTMVLKEVVFTQQIVQVGAAEKERSAEFHMVAEAVKAMMSDNRLPGLPHPMRYANGVATNLMGDDPTTDGAIEGFPDITTTAADKGYTGNLTPRDGYVLYKHDKILADNTTQYQTVSYLTTLTTKYYYTCEADGTVRQWSGPDVVIALEYLNKEAPEVELRAEVDVDIYTKTK
jgi:hypothetical protein